MKTYISLSDALYDCFKDLIGTDEEYRLHEDTFVKKKLKEYIGTKEFKKFDGLNEGAWHDGWREFDIRVFSDQYNK